MSLDLAFVLCEESENVSKNQKLPKVPADISIKNIVQKVFYSYMCMFNLLTLSFWSQRAFWPMKNLRMNLKMLRTFFPKSCNRTI